MVYQISFKVIPVQLEVSFTISNFLLYLFFMPWSYVILFRTLHRNFLEKLTSDSAYNFAQSKKYRKYNQNYNFTERITELLCTQIKDSFQVWKIEYLSNKPRKPAVVQIISTNNHHQILMIILFFNLHLQKKKKCLSLILELLHLFTINAIVRHVEGLLLHTFQTWKLCLGAHTHLNVVLVATQVHLYEVLADTQFAKCVYYVGIFWVWKTFARHTLLHLI